MVDREDTLHVIQNLDLVVSCSRHGSPQSYKCMYINCECYFVGHGNSDRRRSSSNSMDLYLDLDQLQRRHSSVCSDTDSVFSTGHTSMSSVDEDIVEQEHSALTATKRYTMAPLVRHDCISQL